jgi:Carboxypeptidase regulatory-like domain
MFQTFYLALRFICVYVAFAAMCLSLNAEVRVSGQVSSDTGTPVPNAAVLIRETAADERVRTLTDPTGAFSAAVSTPGNYLVSAEASGYFALKEQPITLAAGDNELNLTLAPIREFADAVDVHATTSTVELDTTHHQETLSGAQLLDVPFPAAESLKNAMRILPGVVQDSRAGIHPAGGSQEQALYLLDGFNVGDPLTGRFESRLGIEAVQSMSIETGSFPAEYGKAAAAVLSLDTKTGDDRIRYSATNFVPGIANQKGWRLSNWSPRFNVSGPVRRGRIWFSDNFTGQYAQTVIRELPPGQDTSTSLRYENFSKFQANLTPRNILTGGFLATTWWADRAGLSALDPPQTTTTRRSRQWFGYVKDQIYFGEGALIEFGYAANRTFGRLTPEGDGLYLFTPNGRQGNYFVHGRQDAARDQLLTNAFLPSFHFFGEHQLKTGIDLDRLGYSQVVRRTGYEYLRTGQIPVRKVLYAGNGILGQTGFETSAYVQDSWRVRTDVLVDAGLRWDWDSFLRSWSTSPRVGVAWSPPGLRDTKISGGFGITRDAPNMILFTRPMDQYPVAFLYPPYGQPDVPLTSLFYNPGRGFSSPENTNWTAAIDRRVLSSVFVRLEALRRRGTEGLTYFPSPLSSPGHAIYSLGNHRSDSYDATGITVRQNLAHEYGWMASYIWSRARSNAVVDITTDDPAIVNANTGPLAWDAPHRLLGWAYVPTFWKNWAIACLSEYHTGFPFSVLNELGTVIGPPDAHRFPAFLELNLSVERKFEFRGQRWAGRAGFINITNHRNYNVVNNDINSPSFMAYAGGQSRAFNFRIRWLGKL